MAKNVRHSGISPEQKRRLQARSQFGKSLGLASITGGLVGEQPLLTATTEDGIHIRKMPDDPDVAIRVSIGSLDALDRGYCVYRGDKQLAIEMMERALIALKNLQGG